MTDGALRCLCSGLCEGVDTPLRMMEEEKRFAQGDKTPVVMQKLCGGLTGMIRAPRSGIQRRPGV